MNKLKGQICYLAGYIDDDKDGSAKSWRIDMTKFLNGLGIGVHNPCDKPIINTTVNEDENFVKSVQSLKEEGYYDKASDVMKEIVRQDLKMVDLSHFVVLNINRDSHMCGSYTEFTYACMMRKPVLVYCRQGIPSISNWMWGLGDHHYFYDDWEQLKQQIRNIDSGLDSCDMNGKWRFFDTEKIFGKCLKD
jgi:hypothetical protein